MKKAAFVVFSYPSKGNVVCSLENALDWADSQRKLWSPSEVIWEDGTTSYAKGWWFSRSTKMARIGAGAYGDYVVARR